MSLMRLLAAGRSVMGIKREPGPYRMSQEKLLPKFEPPSKAAAGPAQATASVVQAAPDAGSAPEPAPRQGNQRGHERKPRFTFRLPTFFRRRKSSSAPVAGPPKRPVQGELSLDTVKVVRNDLSDSDGVVGSGRAPGRAGGAPLGMVWNRLSARLLMQAAQEFSLVQKERGKLFTHAGDDGGSARRT